MKAGRTVPFPACQRVARGTWQALLAGEPSGVRASTPSQTVLTGECAVISLIATTAIPTGRRPALTA